MARVNGHAPLPRLDEALPMIYRNQEKGKEGRYNYLDLFRTKDLVLKTITVCVIWLVREIIEQNTV